MPESQVSIVNQAFTHLGEPTVGSLEGDTHRQQVARTLYDPTRKALLTEINWRFATHTQALARRATAPGNTHYKYAFALPTDPQCIKPQHVAPNTGYAIEGDSLLSNANTVLLTYTGDAAEDIFPPYFSFLLGLRLAWAMAMPLTRKQSREDAMEKKFDAYLPTAKFADASQQPNEAPKDAPFVDCRA